MAGSRTRLERLLDQHSRIRALADELEGIIFGRRPGDVTLFWRLRWSMLSLILQNLRSEQTYVSEPLLKDPRPHAVAVIERFNAELADISTRYLDHIIRWDSDDRMADWPLYGDQVQPLIGILRDRMAREESILYPLVWPSHGTDACRDATKPG